MICDITGNKVILLRLNLVLKYACSGKQHMLSSQAESEDKGNRCNDKRRSEYDHIVTITVKRPTKGTVRKRHKANTSTRQLNTIKIKQLGKMIPTLKRPIRKTLPGLQIRVQTRQLFSYFSTKTFVVGTQKNRSFVHTKHMFKLMGTELNAKGEFQICPRMDFDNSLYVEYLRYKL